MNLEIGKKVRIVNLDLATEVFEHVPERSAVQYYKRRKGTVNQVGTLSGSLKEEAGVYYVQMMDGYMTPYHKDELELAA
jgi:hypothetical protein